MPRIATAAGRHRRTAAGRRARVARRLLFLLVGVVLWVRLWRHRPVPGGIGVIGATAGNRRASVM
jgi:hypothetical protein